MTDKRKAKFNKWRRKGMAIELAIGVMLIVIAFSIIMVTVAQLTLNTSKNLGSKMVSAVEVSEIAQDFITALKAENDGSYLSEPEKNEYYYSTLETKKLENGLQSFVSDCNQKVDIKIWLVVPESWKNETTRSQHPYLKFDPKVAKSSTENEIAEPCFFILKGYDKDSGKCILSMKVKAEGVKTTKTIEVPPEPGTEEETATQYIDVDEYTSKFTLISYATKDADYYFTGVKNPNNTIYCNPLLISSDGLSIYGYKNQAGYWTEGGTIEKNSHDLIVWAENAASGEWAYMQGHSGEIVTEDEYNKWLEQTDDRHKDNLDYIGIRGADCYGLVRGYACFDEKTLTVDTKKILSYEGLSSEWQYLSAVENTNTGTKGMNQFISSDQKGTFPETGGTYDYTHFKYHWVDVQVNDQTVSDPVEGGGNEGSENQGGENDEPQVEKVREYDNTKAGYILYRSYTDAKGAYHQHSAIYIGNGLIIQAADYGIGINVVAMPDSGTRTEEENLWTGWFKLPTISYN